MYRIGYVPAKKYRIKLDPDERKQLEEIRDKGVHKSQKYKRSLIMLLSDESHQGAKKSDSEIAKMVGVTMRTVERQRKFCHEVGAIESLSFRRKPPRKDLLKVTGEIEAHITHLACTEAPEGCAVWTTQLIADEIVKLELLDSISSKTVERVLKKAKLPLGEINIGVSQRKKTQHS